MTTVIVILSTDVVIKNNKYVPSEELKYRIDSGVKKFTELYYKKAKDEDVIIILCGKGRKDGVCTSNVMKEYIETMYPKIHSDFILEQPYSTDTIEDAIFVKKIINDAESSSFFGFIEYGKFVKFYPITRLVIVTSNYHIRRSQLCFEKVFNSKILKIDMYPVKIPDKISNYRQKTEDRIFNRINAYKNLLHEKIEMFESYINKNDLNYHTYI